MAGWSLEYSFDVDHKNAVIYAKVHGIWKKQTAIDYHKDFVEELGDLALKPWAKLVDLSNWKTSFPEVIDGVGHHMEWSRQHNVAMSLYVLNNPSTFRQLHEMFTAGGTKEISMTFRTYEEAEQYLRLHWINKRNKIEQA